MKLTKIIKTILADFLTLYQRRCYIIQLMPSRFFLLLVFGVFFFGLFTFLHYQPNNYNNIAINNPSRSLFSRLLPKPDQPIILLAVGDIMLGRSVNAKMRQLNDFQYPFRKTADILRSADLTFGNLESPFWPDCPTVNSSMVFCADPKAIQGLTFSGIDILSIANNHILNYGSQGKQYTVNLLQQNGILSSAENNIAIKQYNNLTIGFLSLDLTKTRSNQQILDMVTRYASQAGILVVSLHWGNEYADKPTQTQKELAHSLIDAGADLIIGHHPHVIQPTEEYRSKLIFYSLGNFVFDQTWSKETRKGNIAKIVLEGKTIKSYEEIPVYLNKDYQPEIVTD